MSDLVLTADIGGTHMRAALVDRAGTILRRDSTPTPAEADAPAALIELVRAVGADRAHGAASHAVVGLPGGVDYETGCLLFAPHLPDRWPELLSRDRLSAQLGLPVHVANDADLAAVGEAVFGAGEGVADVAYLTISTGIGAGLVQQGRLVRGHRSLAEVGHTVIDRLAWQQGLPCTLEELGSGSGVARQAEERGLGPISARELAEARDRGDPVAEEVWRAAVAACAIGVTNLVMAFAPSTVVIGGGLGHREAFFEQLRALALSRPEHFPADLTIVPSALGDDAGLVGGAAWAAATRT